MVTVMFYEKPGCINNTKQKALLQAAGHVVEAYNLLLTPWQPEQLRLFFGHRPVAEWFNRTAPAIKSGLVVPEQLDADTALALMIADPLLIRRPLMQVGDRREVGFETAQVDQWIGLQAKEESQQTVVTALQQQDLQTCPHTIPA